MTLPESPALSFDAPAAQVIAKHSRSFSLASKLLPPSCRSEVHVLYAWCRRADDLVDLQSGSKASAAVEVLNEELHDVYSGRSQSLPLLAQFQRVVLDRSIPLEYPSELIAGLRMDVDGTRYATMQELHRYCYRVAGTVGLMMAHVLGAREPRALRPAAHLGMAMQLTNICRDVAEDWQRGRLYLPLELFSSGAAPEPGSRPLAAADTPLFAPVVGTLLKEAKRLYRSGDTGLELLPWRCSLAVRTARRVYSAIGDRIARRRCDVRVPRAFVPTSAKLWMVAESTFAELAHGSYRFVAQLLGPSQRRGPHTDTRRPHAESTRLIAPAGAARLVDVEVRFPDDILPL